jgi:hypothetical protein
MFTTLTNRTNMSSALNISFFVNHLTVAAVWQRDEVTGEAGENCIMTSFMTSTLHQE